MSSQVEVRIPHWLYLTDEEQEWIQRELGLALAERGKTLALYVARDKEMREEDTFVCDTHADDYKRTWWIAPDIKNARCVKCGEEARKYVLL